MTLSPQAHVMMRMLGWLTRKGAWLEASDGGFAVNMPGGIRRRQADGQLRWFQSDIVELAERRGWIAREGAHWRLTEAGSTALHGGVEPDGTRNAREAAPRHPSPNAAVPSEMIRTPRMPSRRISGGKAPNHHSEAAERLAEDFQIGQMQPRVTSNWDRAALGALTDRGGHPSSRGIDVSERVSAAQERVRRALDDAGPEFADVLIDLVCQDSGIEAFESKQGWPRRSAKVVLALALERLARHYGLVARGPTRGRMQHWGADSYRPA